MRGDEAAGRQQAPGDPPAQPGGSHRGPSGRRSREGPLPRGGVCALACLALAACAAPGLDLAPPAPDQPWQPATGPAGDLRPGPSGAAPATLFLLPANPALGRLPSAPAALQPGHAYGLPELIDLAQQSHPETRVAWANARDAALAAGVARSAYLPQVAADVVGGVQSIHGTGSGLGLTAGERSHVAGTVSAVSVQWLLFDFGERAAVLEAARQTTVVADVAFTGAHQKIIHDVCLAYYARAATHARVASAAQSLSNARDVEAAAQARYARGIGTVVEVAQARQATAQARLAQVHAEASAQDADLALLDAMGLPPLTPLAVADLPDRPFPPDTSGTADQIVADALARRADVLGAEAARQANAARIEAARAEFLPKVFVAATGANSTGRIGLSAIPPVGGQLPTLDLAGTHWGSTLLLGLSVPLYDGGLRESALARARNGADKAQATLEQVQDGAAREVVAARNHLRISLSAHDAARALEDAARITLDAALDAFRQGVGSITDATVAQTQWLQARDARTDAYCDALAAAATLAFATGQLGGAAAVP